MNYVNLNPPFSTACGCNRRHPWCWERILEEMRTTGPIPYRKNTGRYSIFLRELTSEDIKWHKRWGTPIPTEVAISLFESRYRVIFPGFNAVLRKYTNGPEYYIKIVSA